MELRRRRGDDVHERVLVAGDAVGPHRPPSAAGRALAWRPRRGRRDGRAPRSRMGIYLATPDYVHAAELRGFERLLFVSGTMGLDETGAAGADLAESPATCATPA